MKALNFKSSLILGGAKSGKTAYALDMASDLSKSSVNNFQKIYMATAEDRDHEMHQRIMHHQQERQNDNWQTIETPFELPDIITLNSGNNILLVDCLTLWLSNIILSDRDVNKYQEKLIKAIDNINCHIIFVANEVGLGIVPENALARKFRDQAGFLNQAVAKAVDEVIFIAAGCPLVMKQDTIKPVSN